MLPNDAAHAIVSIIVLNRNGMQNGFLCECMASLYSQSYPALEIIVVDNDSSDRSVEFVQQTYPHALVVAHAQNLGFCAGNNSGYLVASGEYVLFLNNDTYLDPRCVENLVGAADRYPTAGMVSPKIMRPLQPDAQVAALDSAGLMLRPDFTLHDRGFGEPDAGQFNQGEFVFGPCGAAAFYRRATLESIAYARELWDERFVAYYEDGDLAWRAHNRGWHCIYWPAALVYHHRGGTASSQFFHKAALYKVHTIKNRYLMLAKNATIAQLAGHALPTFVREMLIWGYLLLHPRLLGQTVAALTTALPTTRARRTIPFLRQKNVGHALFHAQPERNAP